MAGILPGGSAGALMSTIKAPAVGRVIGQQSAILVGLALVTWLIGNPVSAYSFFAGGVISVLPGAVFARMAFLELGASAAQRIVRNFYIGEAVKLAMMGAGFALAFVYIEPLNAAALFAGFLSIHSVGLWLLARLYRSDAVTETTRLTSGQ